MAQSKHTLGRRRAETRRTFQPSSWRGSGKLWPGGNSPLHPSLVNSRRVGEHGQLDACESLIRKNIETDVSKNRHWPPTPSSERI